MKSEFNIVDASWPADKDALLSVRIPVFVDEQGVPMHEELDDKDSVSIHVMALDENGEPVATGRLTPDGHIGRMAVLKNWRGKGAGIAILKYLTEKAKEMGHHEIWLSAQTHAIPFYKKLGYETRGEEYDDCNIPHIDMVLRLASRE